MECRILRSYTVGKADKVSNLRIAVFTKNVEMNLASLQLPLLMRLMRDMGKCPQSAPQQQQNSCQQQHTCENDLNSNETGDKESTFSWVWKHITRLTLTRANRPAPPTQIEGHVKEFGVYIEELSFTLKNSEFVNDAIVGGIKRVSYSPIVRICLGGIYMEKSLVNEIDWESLRIGISSIVLEPLADFRSDTPGDNNVLLETESVNAPETILSYHEIILISLRFFFLCFYFSLRICAHSSTSPCSISSVWRRKNATC